MAVRKFGRIRSGLELVRIAVRPEVSMTVIRAIIRAI